MALRLTEKVTRTTGLVAFLECASMANLCLLGAWRWTPSCADTFFIKKTPPSLPLLATTVAGILAAGLLIYILEAAAVRLAGEDAAGSTFLVLLIVPLRSAAHALGVTFDNLATVLSQAGTLILLAATMLAGLWMIVRWRRFVARTARWAALTLAPLLPIQCAWAFVGTGRSARAALIDQPLAEMPTRDDKLPRIVWIIFDELDQHFTFEARPKSVSMPELDRLRTESLYAENCYPPAEWTLQSVPSLIAGRVVRKAEPSSPDELLISFEGSLHREVFGGQPNVFQDNLQRGGRSAAAGWYIPYCRVLGQYLASCYWEPQSAATHATLDEGYLEGLGAPARLRDQIQYCLEEALGRRLLRLVTRNSRQSLYDGKEQQFARERQKDAYLRILSQALPLAADPRFNLVLLHWPIPHPHGIYDRQTRTVMARQGSNYFDNLALVDETIGRVRRAMEASGTWDTSTVLVSSDHPLRPAFWEQFVTWTQEEAALTRQVNCQRIPFLLKLAHQRAGSVFPEKFNSVVTRDLVNALMTRTIQTERDARMWLSHRRYSRQ